MYVFDNAASRAHARLAALAEVHDPGTIRHLLALGVADGWKCLEIGGGLGTITGWISDRVGPSGYVLTTDIDTRFLEKLRRANVEVRRNDIMNDPLPNSMFDLAYARLVLEHLSDPDLALDRMATTHQARRVADGRRLWVAVPGFRRSRAGRSHLQDGRGHAPGDGQAPGSTSTWVSHWGSRLRARGLLDVGHEGRVQLCRGNTAAARLARLNFEQLQDSILATGQLTTEEFNADLARLDEEDFEWRSLLLWTAWGQRPPSAT